MGDMVRVMLTSTCPMPGPAEFVYALMAASALGNGRGVAASARRCRQQGRCPARRRVHSTGALYRRALGAANLGAPSGNGMVA